MAYNFGSYLASGGPRAAGDPHTTTAGPTPSAGRQTSREVTTQPLDLTVGRNGWPAGAQSCLDGCHGAPARDFRPHGPLSPEAERFLTRAGGVAQMFGGGIEAAVGVVGILAPEPGTTHAG